ncbi:MAG TPA: electron transfer flavoprotein subunit alpha [Archaeoglobaceae archaeon]|nr:electron transfer flavoprotein subunit alpha [Archaeoglobaceae archaeon]
MKICALLRTVPDLVEDIEIVDNEIEPFAYIANERDEHAVEEAVILKEKHGGTVDVIGIVDEDSEDEIEEPLGMALAKGADRAIKMKVSNKSYRRIEYAKALGDYLKDKGYDIVLTGIQAIDAFAGMLGPMLSVYMKIPFTGYVTFVEAEDSTVKVQKELGGGLLGEFRVKLPAILGILSAERPLRFVPLAKLRQVMKKAEIEEVELEIPEIEGVDVIRYYEPEKPEIVLIEGEPEEVADKLIESFKEIGVL